MQKTDIEKIKDLTARVNKWRHEYYNLNDPSVSDAVYDRNYDELERLEQSTGFAMANSPTRTVGYEAISKLGKVKHATPLLSLEKTKRMEDVMGFAATQQVLLMHKLDGLTVKLEYSDGSLVQASTRGNGEEGEDVTHNAGAIDGIPAKIPYKGRLAVAGEAYIMRHTFEKLKDALRDSSGNPYRNARNMAAGAVRCHDPKACAERGVTFTPFAVIEGMEEETSKAGRLEALRSLGFSPCEYNLHRPRATGEQFDRSIGDLRFRADDGGLPIDGIVVSYDDIAYSQSCGRTGHHYKDGLAFKFDDDLHETVLREIEWQPSRSGELSPVAIFDTVDIDGCEVSRASLHNVTFIKELELKPGCRILVSKRNMIIPHVEDNLDRDGYDASILPLYCPCCNGIAKLRVSGDGRGRETLTLRCDNPDCASQKLRKFVHFAGKKAMDIEGLSETTLAKFITKGWLDDFTDIYRLDRHAEEITKMEGFGQLSWGKLWKAIEKSRNTTFERFVIAMDIPMVGNTASRELSRMFGGSLDNLAEAVEANFDFSILNGFGETLYRNIRQWFTEADNKRLWKEMRKMVNVETKTKSAANTGNIFAGRTIVVTGTLENFTRTSINEKIESLGAKAGSAVSSKTDYLIAGEKAGSKLAKARTLGVKVLSEREFLDMAASA